MSNRMNVGELRRQMAERGLSGRDLARLAGVSEATVSHAVCRRPISPRVVRQLAIALAGRPVVAPGLVEIDAHAG